MRPTWAPWTLRPASAARAPGAETCSRLVHEPSETGGYGTAHRVLGGPRNPSIQAELGTGGHGWIRPPWDMMSDDAKFVLGF